MDESNTVIGSLLDRLEKVPGTEKTHLSCGAAADLEKSAYHSQYDLLDASSRLPIEKGIDMDLRHQLTPINDAVCYRLLRYSVALFCRFDKDVLLINPRMCETVPGIIQRGGWNSAERGLTYVMVHRWPPTFVVLTGVVLLGTILRFWGLGQQSFWNNEAASFHYAQGSVGDVVRHSLYEETNPPGFHLLVRFWSRLFGPQEWILRLPSAIAGSLAIILVYFFARKFLSPMGAIIAATLFAVSPLHIWYSQECRTFACWLVFVLCAYLTFFSWLETKRAHWLALNVLFVLLAISFHYFGTHIALVENLYFLIRVKSLERRHWISWLISQVVLALGAIPFAVMMMSVDRTNVAGEALLHRRVENSGED